jgi:acyl dehydratase
MNVTANLFPRTLAVDIRLDDDPRYKGSIHDDAVARAAGYRAALVPGAFVYGHVSRLAIEAWGRTWAETGALSASFRRPVYNGDRLVLSAGPLAEQDGFLRSCVSVTNGDGEAVATGWVALPAHPFAPPDISALPVLPMPEHPRPVAPGDLAPGMPTHSRDRVLSQADFETSLRAFGERHPFYLDGYVHSGCLMRMAMGDTNGGFLFPAPIVLTEAEGQHYALVRPGTRITTSGRILEIFLRNGRHYFISEEHMIADGRAVVARFRRTSIYAYEEASR